MEGIDKHVSKAEDLAKEKKEATEQVKDIKTASSAIDTVSSDGDSDLDGFLKEMRNYISDFKQENEGRQKELENQATELMESLNDRWQKISDALNKMANTYEAKCLLENEEEKNKWIEDFLRDNDLLNDACKELSENLHTAVSSTMEVLNSKKDESLERTFSQSDALQSSFVVSVLTGCLIAVCISKWFGKDN